MGTPEQNRTFALRFLSDICSVLDILDGLLGEITRPSAPRTFFRARSGRTRHAKALSLA